MRDDPLTRGVNPSRCGGLCHLLLLLSSVFFRVHGCADENDWYILKLITNNVLQMVLLTYAYRLQCWYNYRNRAAVFCFVVRTLVIGLLLYYFINNMQTSIFKPAKFRSSSVSFKKQAWIHGKSRKLIRWITAEILLLKCLSYTYHEEQGCIFSYKNTIFLILWARESYVFLLPEAFCVLKYAENAIADGAPPLTRWGSSQRSQSAGERTPLPILHPTWRLDARAFGASIVVLYVIRRQDLVS